MRNQVRTGTVSDRAIASPTPQGRNPKLVRDMEIGDVAWTLPRAVAIDHCGCFWICLAFPVVEARDARAVALIKKTHDSYSIQIEGEWTPLSRMPSLAYSPVGV